MGFSKNFNTPYHANTPLTTWFPWISARRDVGSHSLHDIFNCTIFEKYHYVLSIKSQRHSCLVPSFNFWQTTSPAHPISPKHSFFPQNYIRHTCGPHFYIQEWTSSPKKCVVTVRMRRGPPLRARALIWKSNPPKMMSKVRPPTSNLQILISTVNLSVTISARFSAFFSSPNSPQLTM